MKNPIKILLTFSLILFSSLFLFQAQSVNAFTIRTGENINLPINQTIGDTLIISGQHVIINSPVKGDVYCAGQTVEINSNVGGDIICGGQNVVINGQVGGSVRVAGQAISLDGTVNRNVTVVGQNINSNLMVGGEMLVAGQQFSMNGSTGGDLRYYGEDANINGEIGKNLDVFVSRLNLSSQADVKGKLTYESVNRANISQNAKIAGGIKQIIPPQERNPIAGRQREVNRTSRGLLSSLIVSSIIAILLVLIMPKKIIQATDDMYRNRWQTLGIGFLLMMVVPAIAFFLIFTIIGIPLSILIFIIYFIALFVSRILAGILIGRIIVDNYWSAKKDSLIIKTLIGMLVTSLLFVIPVLGWLLSFFAALWGMGGIYYFFRPLSSTKAVK
jgi:hypothetical protein